MLSVVDFAAALGHARGLEDYRAVVSRARADLGYDGFAYAGMWPTETGHLTPLALTEETVALTDQPEPWVVHYLSRRYAECDPVFRVVQGRSLPLVWGPDFLRGERSTAEDAMMRDAWEWGVRHGLCVVVRASDGTLGMLGLTAREDPAPDAGTVNRFHLMAVHLHEALRPRLSTPPSARARLTARELDVLMWSAQGKIANEIGVILGITPRTVNAHLSSAMRKLGVYSKTHAVARLLTTGW